MANRYNNSYWEEYHKGDAPFQFPVWAIIAGFVAWWPLGFIFLGVNEYSRRQGLRAQTRRPPTPTAAAPAGTPLYAQAQPPRAAAPKSTRPQKKESNTLFIVLLIVGAVLALSGAAEIFDALDMFFWALGDGGWANAVYWIEDMVSGLLPLGLGVGSLLAAFTSRADSRIRKKIVNIVGNADHMYIKEIAEAIPCTQEKCCKHLEKCIDKGVFGDSAYLDMRTKCLVVRGPAPAPKTRPPKPKTEKKPESNDQYQAILDELRRVNDAIPDEKLSEKISRLETVSARIFQQAAADPKKLPQMRKFMDYYLPTSLKLLNTYAELDAQGVEGENITLSKRRIEQAMDTVVVAFENQLDQLFRADAMDVSADIEVMENMLRADGLAGEEPFQSPQLKL